MNAEDETNLTEITLLPDGRICLFGASFEVLSLLRDVALDDRGVRGRLHSIQTNGDQDSPGTDLPNARLRIDSDE